MCGGDGFGNASFGIVDVGEAGLNVDRGIFCDLKYGLNSIRLGSFDVEGSWKKKR